MSFLRLVRFVQSLVVVAMLALTTGGCITFSLWGNGAEEAQSQATDAERALSDFAAAVDDFPSPPWQSPNGGIFSFLQTIVAGRDEEGEADPIQAYAAQLQEDEETPLNTVRGLLQRDARAATAMAEAAGRARRHLLGERGGRAAATDARSAAGVLATETSTAERITLLSEFVRRLETGATRLLRRRSGYSELNHRLDAGMDAQISLDDGLQRLKEAADTVRTYADESAQRLRTLKDAAGSPS